MSDVPVYLVGNFIVDDAEHYRRYEKGFFRCSSATAESFLPTTTSMKHWKVMHHAAGAS